ncbi:MAG TPA: biotin/lipoyl-binding protein, partial [Sumerlaeia bacterium]|nr:biotin/lipoyl-binding protein [Sumerlaeia bacterium]
MRTRVGAMLLLNALLFATLTGCEGKPSIPGADDSDAKKNSTLREQLESLRGIGGKVEAPVVRITTGTICSELSVTGELVPRQSAIVKPLMDGRIAFVRSIKVGDMVEEGELIANIDDRDIEDEIEQQHRQIAISKEQIKLDENDMAQRQKDLEFDRQMVKEGFLNESELRKSELSLDRANIALRQSNLRLEQEENRLQRALRQREKVPIKASLSGMVVLASHLTGEKSATDLLNEEIMALEGTLVNSGT